MRAAFRTGRGGPVRRAGSSRFGPTGPAGSCDRTRPVPSDRDRPGRIKSVPVPPSWAGPSGRAQRPRRAGLPGRLIAVPIPVPAGATCWPGPALRGARSLDGRRRSRRRGAVGRGIGGRRAPRSDRPGARLGRGVRLGEEGWWAPARPARGHRARGDPPPRGRRTWRVLPGPRRDHAGVAGQRPARAGGRGVSSASCPSPTRCHGSAASLPPPPRAPAARVRGEAYTWSAAGSAEAPEAVRGAAGGGRVVPAPSRADSSRRSFPRAR